MMQPSLDHSSEPGTTDFWAHKNALEKRFQKFLDEATPYSTYRWAATATLLLVFIIRIFTIQGFYIVTYALGIYLLNLFLAFLQPKFDPSLEREIEENEAEDGPTLPTNANEEFRPFIRRLPEFKFWYSATKATIISLVATLFRILDIPVFWPILLMYFLILFAITMKRQIKHMMKYGYIPFDIGKRRYTNKK
ncbi:431_t:CDS:2 [Paraglomus brasilianum]|uniref:Protein RER1 n=1 Tax=Paraglomus brasilianum TaxID=144538 RepID=A0A9N9FXZ7_9GLOM|nr:429_t:CDS:2 [Paraglomus brasilianum]CAG8570850.1 431_t:CDS:2 [Paraglomus brasilianum]